LGASWGSHSVETAAGFKVVVGHERDWSLGPATLTTRVLAGVEEQYFSTGFFSVDAEAAYVLGMPLMQSKAAWLIHELEWQSMDEIPLSARLLGRYRPGEQQWNIDLGAQYAIAPWNGDGHRAAVIAQLGYRH